MHCRKIEKKKKSDRFQVFASKDEMSNNKVDVDLVLVFFFKILFQARQTEHNFFN